MRSPFIAGSVRIGGVINPYQIITAPAPHDLVVFSPPGEIVCHRRSAEKLWSRAYDTDPAIVGLFDLNGDDALELLMTTRESAGGMLDVFDAATGTLLWSSPVEPGGTGTVEVADLDGDGRRDVLWAPAASSIVRAYSFARDLTAPVLLWETALPDYTSDPYSFSPAVIADVTSDGAADVVIAGGRGRFTMWVLSAATGHVQQRVDYFNEDGTRVTEGGGLQQMMLARDVDRDTENEVVLIGGHGSSAPYMFQGVAIIDTMSITEPVVYDAHPVGLKYVGGSVADFDGDGKDDLLASLFDPVAGEHVLTLFDARDLSVKRQEQGLALVAVIPPSGDREAIIIARDGLHTELPVGPGDFVGVQVGETTFDRLGWSVRASFVAVAERPFDDDSTSSNAGPQAVTADANADGYRDAILVRADASGTHLIAIDAMTGATLATVLPPSGDLIRSVFASTGAAENVFAALGTGAVMVLGDDLAPTASITIGGYFRLLNNNGHNNEVAIIADLDSDGTNEVYANTSRFDLLRIRSGASGPIAETFTVARGTQEPLVSGGPGPFLLSRNCALPASLCRMDAAGTRVWSTSASTIVPAALPPVAANIGYDDVAGRSIIFAAGSTVYPMPMYALDGATGALLWTASAGPYWDAGFAVSDFDGDGAGDVAFNFATQKASIVSGRDGSVLCDAALGPTFGDLGFVDYNGVPIAIDVDGDGSDEILSAEDNAHMMLIDPCSAAGGASTIRWAAPQAALDDERLSMPAVARVAGRTIIGTGTKRGVVTARYAESGAVAWQKALFAGAASTPARTNGLSSVLALDVDGDGRTEFVVGAEDGFLYALNAGTGDVLWSVNFGAAVGDPIAGDIDGDGRSEIVVPAANGFLYFVDGTVSLQPARADFDGNGATDIVLRNYATGQNALWLMNDTTLQAIVDLPGLPNRNYRFEGVADFDSDGNSDILLRNYATGQNAIWLMTGPAVTTIVDLPGLPNLDFRFEGCADFDGDGDPDIIVRNSASGRNAIWLMEGTSLARIVDLPAVPDLAWEIEGAADFNGDGQPDILFRNYATGHDAVWIMDAVAMSSVEILPSLPNVNYRFDGVADIDADGHADIILRNYATGQNALWLMDRTRLKAVVDLPALTRTDYEINGPR